MTIEEAWKALNYVGPQYEEKAAARALALAVLEVAHQNNRCICRRFPLTTPCDDYNTIHRRIEELS